MAVFPESKTRRPQYGYDPTPEENVKRTAPEAGNSFARDTWGVLRFAARMEFLVNEADANILWAFYETNRLIGFTFFDFEATSVSDRNIGTGNGATTTFTIPGKESTGVVVKVAGVTKTAGTHYSLSAGTGAEGEDRVIFTAGNIPTAGQAVTVTATLRRKYTVEFAERARMRSAGFKRRIVSMIVRERFPLAG